MTNERFHANSFHVWGDEYYDLPIKIPNLDIDILDEQDRLGLLETCRCLEGHGLQYKSRYSL